MLRATLNVVRRNPTMSALLTALVVCLSVSFWIMHIAMGDLTGTLYGHAGDLTGGIAYYEALVDAGHLPWLPGTLDGFAAPEGRPVRWVIGAISPISTSLTWLLVWSFGGIAGLTIYTFLGITLSGVAAFGCAWYATKSLAGSMIASMAVMLFPGMILKAQGHGDFTHLWPLLLVILSVVRLYERPTWRRGWLFAAATLISVSWSPYHILYTAIICLGAAAALLPSHQNAMSRRRTFLVMTPAAVALVGAGVVMLLLNKVAGSAAETKAQGIDQLYAYTARPGEYLLPPQGLFARLIPDAPGKLIETLEGHASNPTESILYVGISVLVLAVVGAVMGLRRSSTPRLRSTTIVCICIAATALIFSAPPTLTIAGSTIPMPSKAIFTITESWRVYARLALVVQCCLGILAGIGVATVLPRLRPRWIAAPAAIALLAFVVADFAPQTNIGTPVPRFKSVQKAVSPDDGTLAVYPLLPADLAPAGEMPYDDMFYPQQAGKQVLNGYAAGSTAERRALWLGDLTTVDVVDGLLSLGVRDVLLRKPNPIAPPGSQLDAPAELQRRISDEFGTLYSLPSRPDAAAAFPVEGVTSPPEFVDGDAAVWMTGTSAGIQVRGCDCQQQISFYLTSIGSARTISMRTRAGREIGSVRVPENGAAWLVADINPRRDGELRLHSSKGPSVIDDALHNGDTRHLTARIGNIAVEPVCESSSLVRDIRLAPCRNSVAARRRNDDTKDSD